MAIRTANTSSLVNSLALRAQQNAQRAVSKGAPKTVQQKARNTRKSKQVQAKSAYAKSTYTKSGHAKTGNVKSAQGKRKARALAQQKKSAFRWSNVLTKSYGFLKYATVTFLSVCICLVFLCGMGVSFLWLYKEATSNDFFATVGIDVVGNVRMSRQMVLDLAELKVGDNSLNVNIAHVEHALLQTPWVEQVSVKRILPDRFVIHIQERMPSFWIRRDGVLYYADVKGKLIAPVETKNFVSLPTLEVGYGMQNMIVHLENYLNDLKSGKIPVDYEAVSALRLSEGKGVELYLDDREMRLCIALEGWSENLERLSMTLGDLARRKELSRVREILSADGNVWVIQNI